eukprot:scaffold82603_cov13-Tisochrysis_lutea.AAC.1
MLSRAVASHVLGEKISVEFSWKPCLQGPKNRNAKGNCNLVGLRPPCSRQGKKGSAGWGCCKE